MQRLRLDQLLVAKKLVPTRSQAESFIKMGDVLVDGKPVTKPGFFVRDDAVIKLKTKEQYVSRAGLKLASVASLLQLEFKDKIMLDVGSSTGGFTDFALRHGAKKVIAVDVGTDQLHPSLRGNAKIELHEKTDIRVVTSHPEKRSQSITVEIETPDIIVIDVSFISLREIIPHLCKFIASPQTIIVAMVKPQFEAGKHQVNKGVIKNDTVRRQILKDFETWAKQWVVISAKADSDVAGSKGNRERFYTLHTPLLQK